MAIPDASTFLAAIAGYTGEKNATTSDKLVRLGTVNSVPSANKAVITFDGDTASTVAPLPCAANYFPRVGDRVLVQPVANSYLITEPVSLAPAAPAAISVQAIGSATPTTLASNSVPTLLNTITGFNFIAPPSGKVKASWGVGITSASGQWAWTGVYIRNGATVGSGSDYLAPNLDLGTMNTGFTGELHLFVSYMVPGMVPGNSYNIQMVYATRANSNGIFNRPHMLIEPLAS